MEEIKWHSNKPLIRRYKKYGPMTPVQRLKHATRTQRKAVYLARHIHTTCFVDDVYNGPCIGQCVRCGKRTLRRSGIEDICFNCLYL